MDIFQTYRAHKADRELSLRIIKRSHDWVYVEINLWKWGFFINLFRLK